jgi:hypothetical protein
VAEDNTSPAGQTIIYPGNGLTLSSANANGATVTLSGNVKTTPTMIPLYSGVLNLVGPMNPTAQTNLVNLGIAPDLTPNVDYFNTYSTDGSLTVLASYYSDGTHLLNGPSGPTLPANDTTHLIPGSSGIGVTIANDAVWVSSPILSQ